MGARSVGNSRNPQSVKALLSRISQSPVALVGEGRRAREEWRTWLKKMLPGDLDAHVTGVVEREDSLTVFADSAAWSARLRFALVEIEPEIRERNGAIRTVTVRVMPRR